VQKAQIVSGLLSGFFERFSARMSAERIEYSLVYMNQTGHVNSTWLEQIRLWQYGIAFPVNASYHDIYPEEEVKREDILGWMTVAMIGVEFLFGGFSAGAAMVVEERERGTLKRLVASPISAWDLFAGKTLSTLAALTLSAVVCVLFGVFAIGARINFDPVSNPEHLLVPALLLVGALFSVGVGLIISIFAKTSKGATGLANALAWPLMFLAGVWFPEYMLPEWLRPLAHFFPLTQIIDAIRGMLVFKRTLAEVAAPTAMAVAATVVVFAVGIAVYKKKMKEAVER